MARKKQRPTLGSKKVKSLSNVNPFELKFNRLKHDVLGKKKGSLGVGYPGLSRKRAYEQREKSLGVEYDRRGKVNKIVDKRIGERSKGISSEEKASMRFSAERWKHLKKSSKFNLADDSEESVDVLTHGGEILTTVQKYDRTIASDDEDDTGDIGADVVKVAHFGGGPSNNGGKLSRKEIIADLIAKTREARENKHYAKDEMETITEGLDAKYLKILNKVKNSFHPTGSGKVAKVDKDDYDRLALSLKLDADLRATPAERTKTAEELAMDERHQLEEMELLRIARMNLEKNKHDHISVDAEGNNEELENRKGRSEFEVCFDFHGKMVNANKVERFSKEKISLDSDEELSDGELGVENEEELDDLLQEINNSGESSIVPKPKSFLREKQDKKTGEEEEEDGSDDDGNGKDEEEEGRGEEGGDDEHGVMMKCAGQLAVKREMNKLQSSCKPLSFGTEDLEVPFIIQMPRSFEEFVCLIAGYPKEKVNVILLRLIKCYHPSLAEGNKELLSKLFLYLLRFFDVSSSGPLTSSSVKMLGSLTNVMYVLMKFDVEFSVRCIRALIRQYWKKRLCSLKSSTPFSVIALLRLVASMYPVSDSWHPVCSPAMALGVMTLAKCHVRNLTVLAQQILLVTVISDFVEESKRFVPEAVAFCQGALLLAVENEEGERAPTVVFPISLPHRRMLNVKENLAKDAIVQPLRISEVFAGETTLLEECDIKRCQILRALIVVIRKYYILYSAHEHTFTTTFTPFLDLLKRIPLTRLPSVLAEEIESLIKSVEAECRVRSRLTQMTQVRTEKSMLKMLEPRLEEHFDPERPRVNRDQRRKGGRAEKEKLQYLVKKETRGAIKELRKDATFLSRKKRRETASKDRDRREKTKRIIGELQSQQGEWNKELWESNKKKKK